MLHHSCGYYPQYQTNLSICEQLLQRNISQEKRDRVNYLYDALKNRAIFWGSCAHLWHDTLGYPMNETIRWLQNN